MKLSKLAIKQFMEIYRKDYGVSLEIDTAEKIATNFFYLMKMAYKPLPKKD